MKRIYFDSFFILFSMILFSGCSLFFGNIKPVEERSTVYGIEDLAKTNPAWIKLSAESIARSSGISANTLDSSDPSGESFGISDAAFQSKSTASIISINSVCKGEGEGTRNEDLKELTHELLLGVSDISSNEQVNLVIANKPALETTIRGKINNEEMVLKTVVLQERRCVYDLMFVSRPRHFEKDLPEFLKFVSSLKIK